MDLPRSFRSAAFAAVLVLAACGSEGPVAGPSGSTPIDLPSSETEGSDTTGDDPAPDGPQEIDRCSTIAAPTTDVIGDGAPDIDDPVRGVYMTYASEHPDTFAGMWIDRDAMGTFVLAFTDDPAMHREALSSRAPSPDDIWAGEPRPEIDDDRPIGERDDVFFDVVQVAHSEVELLDAQRAAASVASGGDFEIRVPGIDVIRNRVLLSSDDFTVTPDEAARFDAAIRDAGADVSLLCLEAEIVDAADDGPAFAPGDELDLIVLPDASGGYPADTPVQCSGTEFHLGDLAALTPVDEVDDGLRSVLDAWLEGGEGQFWTQQGWTLLFEDGERAQFISVDDAGVSFVGAEMGSNGWIWAGASGGGPCDVVRLLPDGLSAVEWAADPTLEVPDAGATELNLLATETSCTSGSEMGERLLGPDVVETDDTVRIVLAAVALTGSQNCPDNPSTPVVVTLDAPLGDRVLLDGLEVGPLTELIGN